MRPGQHLFHSIYLAAALQDVVASRTGAVGAARSPLIKLEQRVCPCQPGPKEYRAGLKGLHE